MRLETSRQVRQLMDHDVRSSIDHGDP